MPKSLTRNLTRRKVAVAAASIAAAGALAVPGVAWAQNALPDSEPVAVAIPAAETTAACSTENLTDEELQTLIDDSAENGAAAAELVASTETVAASAVTEADAAAAVPPTNDGTDAVMITAHAC